MVTLHHFVHPAWLGTDAWLSASVTDHYVDYVRTAVPYLNHAMVAKGYAPVRYYITINEPNMLVLNTYLVTTTQCCPGWRPGNTSSYCNKAHLLFQTRLFNTLNINK
jgi:beta-glucosidase/6-phospho-beta-glucosidase/beta-galactosidase